MYVTFTKGGGDDFLVYFPLIFIFAGEGGGREEVEDEGGISSNFLLNDSSDQSVVDLGPAFQGQK